MSIKKEFVCKKCNYTTAKWLGKCPECNSWNSFEERVKVVAPQSGSNGFLPKSISNAQDFSNADNANFSSIGSSVSSVNSRPYQLSEILQDLDSHPRAQKYAFSTEILNKFWGGGLTSGSLTLLAGEPGNGKSTFALQLLRSLSVKSPNLKLLYITAEESVFELARRSRRLNIPKHISVLQSNNYEHIEQVIETTKPEVVIIDSIQTIFSSFIPSSPGSVAQVSKLASQFLAISKSFNISIIIIGHVTKEGQIAGPKTLEHLVDSVLTLENSENIAYRTLSFSKNRFGTTESMLLLKMEENGLEIVTDPSLALLENLESGVGVVYSMAMDKDLPLIVEIQALVSIQNSPNGYGRREAIGMPVSRLNTILAIAEKFLQVSFKPHDVYIQLLGLPKNVYDDSLDMAVLLAVLSSLFHTQISGLLKKDGSFSKNLEEFQQESQEEESVKSIQISDANPINPTKTTNKASSKKDKTDPKKDSPKVIYTGRLTLSGKIRPATNLEKREQTAKQLGFEINPNIKPGNLSQELIL